MNSPIDAGTIMQVARAREEEEKRLKGTPYEAILKKREAEFNNIPVGAKCYVMSKLFALDEMNPGMIHNGEKLYGYPRVSALEMIKFRDTEGAKDTEETPYIGKVWECQAYAKPRIDSVFYLKNGPGNWGRTSLVKSYYVHEDPDNYVEHPDKLVLPSDFPVDRELKFPPMEPGDIVIVTMNSIYHVREIPGREFVAEIDEEQKLKTA